MDLFREKHSIETEPSQKVSAFFDTNFWVSWALCVFKFLLCKYVLWCWEWKVKVAQLCLTLWDPMGYTVHGILQARMLEWVAFPFFRGSSKPRSPASQVDSLPAEPQRKPKNTGVGSLSLLQRLFPTQESN